MGLLDFLTTDDAQLGLGLLAAAGPSTTPQSLGQRLAGGVQYAQATKDGKLKSKLLQSQIEENAVQNQLRQAQVAQSQRKLDMDQAFMGGLMGGGAGIPTTAGAPSTPAAGGGMTAQSIAQTFGVPLQAVVADYQFNGGKKIAEMIADRAKPNWMNVNGNLVNTNDAGFSGGVQGGVSAGSDGRVTQWVPDGKGGLVVGAPRGALETYGAYQGIGNRSAADFQPETVIDQTTGQKVLQPRSQVLQPTLPGGPIGTARGYASSGLSGGSTSAAANEQRGILRAEFGKAQAEMQAAQQRGDTAGASRAQSDMQDIQREIARLPGQSAQSGQSSSMARNVVELSPAQQAVNKAAEVKAVDTAKADVARDTEAAKKTKSAGTMIAAADRAIELLEQGPTQSGIGEAADKTLNFFGMSTKGAQIASQLDIIAGDLVNNVPRMEGAQSNSDMVEYRTQAGRAADRTVPVPQRTAAMQEVKRLQEKYANGAPTGGASGTFDAQPKTNVVAQLPKTAKVGARVRDTDTNTVLKFDGMTWKPE